MREIFITPPMYQRAPQHCFLIWLFSEHLLYIHTPKAKKSWSDCRIVWKPTTSCSPVVQNPEVLCCRRHGTLHRHFWIHKNHLRAVGRLKLGSPSSPGCYSAVADTVCVLSYLPLSGACSVEPPVTWEVSSHVSISLFSFHRLPFIPNVNSVYHKES